MNTDIYQVSGLQATCYDTPNWTDLQATSHTVALAVRDYIAYLRNHVDYMKTLDDHARSLCERHETYMSLDGKYGFERISDVSRNQARWNVFKCECLIELTDELYPVISIIEDDDNIINGRLYPAVIQHWNKNVVIKISEKVTEFYKIAGIPKNYSFDLLLISKKAIEVLKAYQAKQEIQAIKEKELENERQQLLEKQRNKECCILL